MSYTTEQKQYLTKSPANIVRYETATFSHDDFAQDHNLLLITDPSVIIAPKELNGVTYTPIASNSPVTTNQESDPTKIASITFGRVGAHFRRELRNISTAGSLKPITCTLRIFQSNSVAPIWERKVYVAPNGINIDMSNVTVRLTVDNQARTFKQQFIYDQEFTGLLA